MRASHTHHVPHVGLPQSAPVQSAMNVNSAPVGASALRHHRRQPRVEDQPDARPRTPSQIEEHRHPRRRHVDEDDAVGLALLRVGGRDEEADPEAATREHDRQRARSHGLRRAGERVEASPATAKRNQCDVAWRRVSRHSSAIAQGGGGRATARRTRRRASSMAPSSDRWPRRRARRAAPRPRRRRRSAPARTAAGPAATSSAPPPRRPSVSAAPIAPSRLSKGVPSSSDDDETRAPRAPGRTAARATARAAPAAGRTSASGPRSCRRRCSRERLRRERHLLERAVRVVGGEQARQREHARRAAPRPTARRARCARSRAGSGPTASGKRLVDDDEEEQRRQDFRAPTRGQQQIAPQRHSGRTQPRHRGRGRGQHRGGRRRCGLQQRRHSISS